VLPKWWVGRVQALWRHNGKHFGAKTANQPLGLKHKNRGGKFLEIPT